MPNRPYTSEEMAQAVLHNADNDNIDTMNGWLARGDGIAIYENVDLGHPLLGHKIFLSFGSADAMIQSDEPPGPCPVDLGSLGLMHWRYHLDGTYRGPALEHYDEPEGEEATDAP